MRQNLDRNGALAFKLANYQNIQMFYGAESGIAVAWTSA